MTSQELTNLYAKMIEGDEDASLQGILAGIAERDLKKNKSSIDQIKPEIKKVSLRTKVREAKKR